MAGDEKHEEQASTNGASGRPRQAVLDESGLRLSADSEVGDVADDAEAQNLADAFLPEGFRSGDRSGSSKPSNFTVGLTLFDIVPVALFGIASVLLGNALGSQIFLMGAILGIVAGAGKVLWKVALISVNNDEWRLNRQFVILMPVGLALMAGSLFFDLHGMTLDALASAALSVPAVIFLALTVAGIVALIVLDVRGAKMNLRDNWREEIANCATQLCFLIFALLVI